MVLTETQAQQKICQEMSTPEQRVNCSGSDCMAWQPGKTEKQTVYPALANWDGVEPPKVRHIKTGYCGLTREEPNQ